MTLLLVLIGINVIAFLAFGWDKLCDEFYAWKRFLVSNWYM